MKVLITVEQASWGGNCRTVPQNGDQARGFRSPRRWTIASSMRAGD